MGFARYHALVRSLTECEPLLLLTHAHWDHVGDAHRFRTVMVHESEANDLRNGTPNLSMRHWFDERHLFGVELPEETDPETTYIPGVEPDGFLADGDVIDLGGRGLEVLHTPGHSTGSVSFFDRENRLLFPGDAVTAGAMLCNFSGTEPLAYRDTLRKLAELAAEIDWVFPAHMDAPVEGGLLVELHEAYEAIWLGDVEPRVRREGTDIFRFDGFSFWLSAGRYGDQAETNG